MLKPSELLTSIVAKWRLIDGLVGILLDSEKIYAYQPAGATETYLMDAISRMPAGSVMVAWEGTSMGSRAWEHNMGAYIRPSETASCEAIFDQLIDGIATGDPLRAYDMPLHADCDPLTHREVEPLPLVVHADAVIELWKWSFTLPEIGG